MSRMKLWAAGGFFEVVFPFGCRDLSAVSLVQTAFVRGRGLSLSISASFFFFDFAAEEALLCCIASTLAFFPTSGAPPQ